MIINSPVNIFVVSTDHYIKDEYEKLRRSGNFNTFGKHKGAKITPTER